MDILVTVHSYLRWVVLVLGIIALFKASKGKTAKSPFTESDRKIGLFFMISCHTQLLIGLILYFFVSPFGIQAFSLGMKEVMGNAVYRKIAVEHVFMMIIALVLITMGYSKNKKDIPALQKHKNAFLFFGLGILLILAGIPWNRM